MCRIEKAYLKVSAHLALHLKILFGHSCAENPDISTTLTLDPKLLIPWHYFKIDVGAIILLEQKKARLLAGPGRAGLPSAGWSGEKAFWLRPVEQDDLFLCKGPNCMGKSGLKVIT